jgi:hypothetical protein
MSRPRIRTIKPELWQDEKVGGLGRDARLLFIGLVTMADDAGRLRALPAVVLGHCVPYDTDALRKVEMWLEEIAASGLVTRYEVGGTPYVQINGWRKHQVINRPSPSELPPVPGTEDSVSDHGTVEEGSSLVRGRARPDRIGSDQEGKGPPLPPDGGRKRDLDLFLQETVSWATANVPDIPPPIVAGAISNLRAANCPECDITPYRIRQRVRRSHPHLQEVQAA